MKVLCPGCERLVTPAAARLDGDHVVIECPKCGAEDTVALSAVTAKRPSSRPPERTKKRTDTPNAERCPKCGEPRSDGDACTKCGLVFARWNPKQEVEPSGEAAELWEQLESRWDDESLHQRFLTICLERKALSFAARCYRSHDDEISRQQLERLTTLGVQAMQVAEQPGRLNPRIFRIVGWTVFFAICIAIVVVIFSYRFR